MRGKKKLVEMEAADALLDVGVSLPLFSLRIPFLKKRVFIRVTMKRPYLGGIIRLSELYLTLGCTVEQMEHFTKEQEIEFVARHGKTLSRMAALMVCRGCLSGLLLARPLAWLLRQRLDDRCLFTVGVLFSSIAGTKSFMPIITSAGRMSPMKPKVSQEERKGRS